MLAWVLVTDASQHSFGLDAAQYGMLWALYQDWWIEDRGSQIIPTERLPGSATGGRKLCCTSVPWNRHFIIRLQQLAKAHLLVDSSAIT